ncbi:MAG: hypothetical protein H0T79_22065 [Deltaproteobacteria bacterium]|nr:hypothetical protein [Deltaproteobacteria bacterium]
MRLVVLLVVALGSSAAAARPTADLVIVWAPNASSAPIAAVARDLGAAMIDRSPRDVAPVSIAPLVTAGVEAYDTLRFDDAARALERARDAADRTGGATLDPVQLADIFLYRALLDLQLSLPDTAWDDLIVAATINPTRVLDPARFPPRVIAMVERARAVVAERPIVTLELDVPTGCTLWVDGIATGTVAPVATSISYHGRSGPHWVRVTCRDRAPWGVRVDLTTPRRLAIEAMPYQPPDDAEAVIQARAATARAVAIVEVRGTTGIARIVGLDGRERDRRSVTIASSTDLTPLADALRSLLAPQLVRPWYRARWVWMAGAAALTAAILIPITVGITRDGEASSLGVALDVPEFR